MQWHNCFKQITIILIQLEADVLITLEADVLIALGADTLIVLNHKGGTHTFTSHSPLHTFDSTLTTHNHKGVSLNFSPPLWFRGYQFTAPLILFYIIPPRAPFTYVVLYHPPHGLLSHSAPYILSFHLLSCVYHHLLVQYPTASILGSCACHLPSQSLPTGCRLTPGSLTATSLP